MLLTCLGPNCTYRKRVCSEIHWSAQEHRFANEWQGHVPTNILGVKKSPFQYLKDKDDKYSHWLQWCMVKLVALLIFYRVYFIITQICCKPLNQAYCQETVCTAIVYQLLECSPNGLSLAHQTRSIYNFLKRCRNLTVVSVAGLCCFQMLWQYYCTASCQIQ